MSGPPRPGRPLPLPFLLLDQSRGRQVQEALLLAALLAVRLDIFVEAPLCLW